MHICGSNPLVYVYLSMHYPIDWIMRSNWWISFKRHMQGGSICFIFHYYDSLKSIWNQFNKVWESISEWKVLPFGVIETHRALPWPGFEPGLSRPQREVLTTIRSRPYRQLVTEGLRLAYILADFTNGAKTGRIWNIRHVFCEIYHFELGSNLVYTCAKTLLVKHRVNHPFFTTALWCNG